MNKEEKRVYCGTESISDEPAPTLFSCPGCKGSGGDGSGVCSVCRGEGWVKFRPVKHPMISQDDMDRVFAETLKKPFRKDESIYDRLNDEVNALFKKKTEGEFVYNPYLNPRRIYIDHLE